MRARCMLSHHKHTCANQRYLLPAALLLACPPPHAPFTPPGVQRVTVYPSDYGLERMAAEQAAGPQVGLGQVARGGHMAHAVPRWLWQCWKLYMQLRHGRWLNCTASARRLPAAH